MKSDCVPDDKENLNILFELIVTGPQLLHPPAKLEINNPKWATETVYILDNLKSHFKRENQNGNYKLQRI